MLPVLRLVQSPGEGMPAPVWSSWLFFASVKTPVGPFKPLIGNETQKQ